MEKAVLDLTGCGSLPEMHERIKTALVFPDYYGRNWDAFWDCLVYESSVDQVEIHGEHTLPEELGPSLEKMHRMLRKVNEKRAEMGWRLDFVILD